MKKIINNPEEVINDMIQGMIFTHSDKIKKLENYNVILRKNLNKKKVSIISGGGSGHEPAHGGFVGFGMLDAAVVGEVFTSPTPDQIFNGIKAIDNGLGILMIIKNYSGDIMNFTIAEEMAQANGVEILKIIVDDDVAVENSTYTTGRRGIAGTIFVHKITGAMAENGASLKDIHKMGEKVVKNVRSKGIALSSCVIPSVGKPNFQLGEDEIEIGMGIHGEPGVKRAKIMSAREIADNLVKSIILDLPFNPGEEVAVLVNGLGGTPLMELYILNRNLAELCQKLGLKIYKTYVNNFMTSLEMAGASISILKLDQEMKYLLDYPANTPAFVQWKK